MNKCYNCQHVEMCSWREDAKDQGCEFYDTQQVEPLTDTEQRIFYAAMGREENICTELCADGEGVDLVEVCHNIRRKVRKALWKQDNIRQEDTFRKYPKF